MTRIDRARFDATAFPVVITIPTRYDDLDTQGHVNNAAAIVILQEARAKMNKAAGLPRWRGGDLRVILAAITVEYAAELHYPEPVEVHCGILSIGRTSFTIVQLAKQHGQTAIYCESVTVITDTNGPIPLPDELRGAYAGILLP